MKRLISVVDIKTLSEKGQTEFMVDDDTLITPAARDAANEFGVKIVKAAAPCCTATVPAVETGQVTSANASPVVTAGAVVERSQAVSPATYCPPVPGYRESNTLITSPWPEAGQITNCAVRTQPTPSSATTPWPKANPVAFQAIAPTAPQAAQSAPCTTCSTEDVPAAVPTQGNQGVDPAMVAQIVQQVMSQLGVNTNADCPQSDLVRAIDPEKGFMLIKGDSVKLEPFNDGEKDYPGIWIKEFTNPKESPNLTSGIMQFDHSQLPWTLTYDEMDYVLEGTLEFIVNGKKYTGYPGDSFYIPANTTVTFSTPDHAKFFFVTYPANWFELI